VAVLPMRLRELSDQCRALGVVVVHHYALAVVDVDTGPLGAHARHSVLRHVATAAQRTFRAGETITATDSGRVIVLLPRRRDLPQVIGALLAEVQDRPELARHRVHGWIEILPPNVAHRDALIEELAG
jgi:hypothetical protein